METLQWEKDLKAQPDLVAWGGEGIGLYALGARYGVEDLSSVGAEAITDGKNDRKIDLIYVDTTNRAAFVMQCYRGDANLDKAAKKNKADDLNTAASYVLSTPVIDLPEALASHIEQVRDAINRNQVDVIHFWYVHNKTEHPEIQEALTVVEETARSHLNRFFKNSDVRVSSLEVGRYTIEKWYDIRLNKIQVVDDIELKVSGAFIMKSDDWEAIVSSVEGKELHKLYQDHGSDLFSLNVRDYLGIVKKDANVNSNMRRSASEEPRNFWAFNNGITGIVNDYKYDEPSGELILKGLSIVNGAQTTGAIGNLEEAPDKDLQVPARFFKAANSSVISGIIRYNNSQNAIEAADFRSKDQVQDRLREEFTRRTDADYDGGRRGSSSDTISRSTKKIPNYTVGQALTAFHGDPVLAYNEKSKIWIDNERYQAVFNDDTSAAHIVFAISLLRAIEATKNELIKKTKADGSELSRVEQNRLSFFRKVGANFLLTYVVSESIEITLDRGVGNKFRLSFGELSMQECITTWMPVINTILAFAPRLTAGLNDGLKSLERMRETSSEVTQLVEATKESNSELFEAFRKKVKVQ